MSNKMIANFIDCTDPEREVSVCTPPCQGQIDECMEGMKLEIREIKLPEDFDSTKPMKYYMQNYCVYEYTDEEYAEVLRGWEYNKKQKAVTGKEEKNRTKLYHVFGISSRNNPMPIDKISAKSEEEALDMAKFKYKNKIIDLYVKEVKNVIVDPELMIQQPGIK